MSVLRSPVERQEPRLIARKVRAHPDLVLTDREVDDRTAFVHQKVVPTLRARFDRLALRTILVDRILNGLGEFCLDFGGAVVNENTVGRRTALAEQSARKQSEKMFETARMEDLAVLDKRSCLVRNA